MTVIVKLAKNYAITFSVFLNSLLSISSKIADLRQWMEWQTCLEEIQDVLFLIRWNSLEYFWNIHQNDVADLKIVLSDIMQHPRKIKKITKKKFKMFCEFFFHHGWKKILYLKTFRRYMSHSCNVLKDYINRCLGRQHKCCSGVETYQ